MKLKNREFLSLFMDGEIINVECEYACKFCESIPIYFSDKFEKGLMLLELDDNTYMLLVDTLTLESMDRLVLEIRIWDIMLKAYGGIYKDKKIREVCLSNWYGVQNVLMSLDNNADDEKFLQKVIRHGDVRVPSRDNIITKFKGIDIGE